MNRRQTPRLTRLLLMHYPQVAAQKNIAVVSPLRSLGGSGNAFPGADAPGYSLSALRACNAAKLRAKPRSGDIV
jgi:hypothetical protein